MYPRNAASPEPIAIGPVVQISDGAVQSSGVTVRIKPVGVSEADGGGTTAYSTDGVVLYTPTQAETNYTSFVLIAKKTGCIPASVTVVTTASATAGYAGVDWSKVTAATSTVALTNTTISTDQAVASVAGAVGSVTGAVGSVTSRVTANTDQWNGVTVTGMPMPTYTQPTGFLAATFPATVSSYAGGAVASVTGAVGSVTDPVTVGTNNDKTGYSLTTAPPTAAAIADAVWDEAYSGHTTAGTFGKLMDTLRKANTVLEGTIQASPTPTTSVFKLSGVDYPTGALIGSVLWMNSGASQEQNSPILSTVNNGDGTITVTLENALVTAPSAGDTVLIDPTSHVHSVAEIQSGLATATNLLIAIDRVSYCLSALAGNCSDAQTAAETYVLSIGGNTYTVDYSGLDGSGNRGTTTLTKA